MRRTMRALLLVGAVATVAAWGTISGASRRPRLGAPWWSPRSGASSPEALDETYFQPFGRDAGVKVTMDPDNIKQVVVPDLAWVSQHRTEIVKRWTEWLQK